VIVSDVTLLKNIRNSGVAKKNLKEIIVLIARILSIVFLVFAFSDPIDEVDGGVKKTNSLVKIHIDNSYSMAVHDYEGELLEEAKLIAELIIDQYGVNDRFQIQSNDFSFSHEKTWQKKEAKNKLAEINLSTKVRSFESVLARMNENKESRNDLTPVRYLISDFNYEIDTVNLELVNQKLNCVVVRAEEISNVYVDSVWFKQPERKIQGFDTLSFSVFNTGEKDLNDFSIALLINGNTQLTSLDLPAKKNTKGVFVYKVPDTKNVKGVVSIDDPALPFDNKMYFSYGIPDKVKVLVVSNSGEFAQVMTNLFDRDENVECKVVSDKNIDYEMIDEYDVFVMGELGVISSNLKVWLEKIHSTEGKQTVIIPSGEIDVASYNAFGLEVDEFEFSEVDSIEIELLPVNKKSVFFNHVFKNEEVQSNLKVQMPLLGKHYEILRSKGATIMRKSNQKDYLTKSKKTTLFSSGITNVSSDFSKHPLIVPVFLKIVFSSVLTEELFTVYSEQRSVTGKVSWGKSYGIKSPNANVFNGRIIDEVNNLIHLGGNFSTAGVYEVLINDSLVDYIAVNQSRMESSDRLSMFNDLKNVASKNEHIELLETLSGSSSEIREQIKGKVYWKLFLMLSGLCLLAEMLIIRIRFNLQKG